MKGRVMIGGILLAAFIVFVGYVRLSANDPEHWHVDVPAFENKRFAGGAIRVIDGDTETMERLDEIILASKATRIAGSAVEGHATYMSRTKVFGFPDFTTVQMKDGKIALYGRLRFGQSDLGVNGKRIDAWLNVLARAAS